jgi:uncharacterized protein YdeI (YjbR/CyaY-like superfamily)
MKTLYVEERSKWRAWLKANCERAAEIWLVYYKEDTGRARIAYADAVEEAICFGWIDSKIKKLDEARFVQLFTPRQPKSKWSSINIERARRMIREGKMSASGLRVFDRRNQTSEQPTKLPAPLREQFQKHEAAWENFQRFPPAYQRLSIGWVASAKKEETQIRRLRHLIAESAANKRIKFM